MTTENTKPPSGGKGVEQFIRDHRDDFDDLKAPKGLFDKIVPRENNANPIWKWMAVAASTLLLISVGYIVGTRSQPESRIAGWNEFQEAEQYYQSRIDTKMDELKSLPVSNEVLSDIQTLDEVYAQLRKQLLDDPNADSKVLLSAMIKHQKQKLDVMDQILHRVEKYKKNENDKRNEM